MQVADLYQHGIEKTIDAGVSVGASLSESHGEQHDSTVKGSAIKAVGDVTISATGAGKDSNVAIIGSDIAAGGNVHLTADNQVDTLAGQNTHSSHTHNKRLGGSVGFSVQKGWNGSVSAMLPRDSS
jgi:filamentous hemagglutinin